MQLPLGRLNWNLILAIRLKFVNNVNPKLIETLTVVQPDAITIAHHFGLLECGGSEFMQIDVNCVGI